MKIPLKKFIPALAGVWLPFSVCADIIVNTLVDEVADNGECSLREAITNANNNDQSGSSDCAAGTVNEIIRFDSMLAGGRIVLNGTELPRVTDPRLAIRGPVTGDPGGITIDGNGQSRILRYQSNLWGLELSDITLTGGRTLGPGEQGGAILVHGNLTLNHVRVTESVTEGAGSHGGGIAVTGGFFKLIDSEIYGNRATGHGGGVYMYEDHLSAARSTLSGNEAGGDGGGVYYSAGVDCFGDFVDFTETTISGNQAGGSGGGVFYYSPGVGSFSCSISFPATTISGNQAGGDGGGVHCVNCPEVFSNSTISGNQADGRGGGLAALGVGEVNLNFVTLAHNQASEGGALFISESDTFIMLHRSLLLENDCELENADNFSTSYSLATDDTCPGIDVATISDIALQPLSDNGGLTLTHALDASSVAVNAVPADGWCLEFDQRGQPRPGGGTTDCDAGAFEVQVVTPPPEADLTIAQMVIPTEAELGESVSFMLEANNLGADASSGVAVDFSLPDLYTLVSANASTGIYDDKNGQWSIGDLAAGAGATLSIEATAGMEGTRNSTAVIEGDQFDPDASNNGETVQVQVYVVTGPVIVDTLADEIADNGECALREAILNVSAGDQSGSTDCGTRDWIRFDPALAGGRIVLNGTELPALTDNIGAILGPVVGDPSGITLDGNGQSRILRSENGFWGLELADMTLTGGRTMGPGEHGGAILAHGHLTLYRVRVTDSATEGAESHGGGIAVIDGFLDLIDSEISGNSASGHGGGMYKYDNSLNVRRSTLSGNQASGDGGGVYCVHCSPHFYNSTISGNQADGSGGGVAKFGYGFFVDLSYVTLVHNQASSGGALFVDNSASRTVVERSLRPKGKTDVNLTYSLLVDNGCVLNFVDNTQGAYNFATDDSCPGTTVVTADTIALLPLEDNGGATPTQALDAGSVAIDVVPVSECWGFDQRGKPRPGLGTSDCDAGAFEWISNELFSDKFSAK